MATKKTWREKLQTSNDLPAVKTIEGTLSQRWGEGTVVIPAPLEVDAAMRSIPKGKLTTIELIRTALAEKHGATLACPITTGIFAWIASYAAEEDQAAGRRRTTPYWRTLKTGGELNPKYPGGIARLKEQLLAEGHQVIQRGKRYFVADYVRVAVPPKRA